MRYKTIDLLACPDCRHYPLVVHSFNERKMMKEKDIVEGLLLCKHCKKWYPIIESVPRMLPESLRDDHSGFFLKHKKSFWRLGLKLQ